MEKEEIAGLTLWILGWSPFMFFFIKLLIEKLIEVLK